MTSIFAITNNEWVCSIWTCFVFESYFVFTFSAEVLWNCFGKRVCLSWIKPLCLHDQLPSITSLTYRLLMLCIWSVFSDKWVRLSDTFNVSDYEWKIPWGTSSKSCLNLPFPVSCFSLYITDWFSTHEFHRSKLLLRLHHVQVLMLR